MADKTCPKCARRMEEGFTIDAGDYSVPAVGVWHRGRPQKSWLGLKTNKADKHEIAAWRCASCHFVELYAP